MNTLLRLINVIFLLHNTLSLVYAKEKIVRYSDSSLSHISSIQTDTFTGNVSDVRAIAPFGNDSVLMGTINFIAQFSLDLKQVKKIVSLEPTSKEIERCGWRAKNDDECRNYITSIITLPDDRIYTCGTYALEPRCWTLDKDLSIVKTTATLNYLNPLPQYDITITRTDPNTFIGSKKIAVSNYMGSENIDFQSPNFVSSYLFESSEYVYFFLREVAEVQSINDKRQYMFSYVARVCKFDNGHYLYSRETFLSLLKAQLVCKKKGSLVATYYDEIQTTMEVTIGNEKFIYGVFTTSSERGGDTAICRYKVKDIIHTFEYSNILMKEGGTVNSKTMSSDRAFISRKNCNSSFTQLTHEPDFDAVKERKSNILLSDKIESSADQKEALFTLASGTTSMAIDELADETGKKKLVYFFGTTDGFVYKLIVGGSGATVLEKIQPFKELNPIHKVVVFKDFVYAGGPTGLTSFRVQRCENYLLCSDCVGNRDPYCTWKNSVCLASRIDVTSSSIKCPPAPNDLSCSISQINRGALRCSSSKSVIFHGWILDSRKIGEANDGFDVTSDSYKSTLVIRNLTAESTGTYQCVIGNDLHRSSCTFELEAQNSTPKTLTTTTISSTTHTATSKPSSTKPISDPTDITKIVTPAVAPTQEKKKDFFPAFLGTLILLLLILLVLLAFVLYKNCRSTKSPRAEENCKSTPTKINGLSPIKKGEKYEVSGNKKNKEVCIEMTEDSMLLQKNDEKDTIKNGGTEKDNAEEKASSPTVEETDSLIVST